MLKLSKMRSKALVILPTIVIIILASGFKINFQETPKPWPVPEKNAKIANPIKSDAESLKTGKEVWAKHCQSCHGKAGKGDGQKAAQLKTAVGDFTTGDFQKQSDGALFYKTAEGRDDMPSFKKKIPDADELWAVVNYMRTMKK
jgi:mono/diheme cytochrome c family protein